jgi:hypothetical protein
LGEERHITAAVYYRAKNDEIMLLKDKYQLSTYATTVIPGIRVSWS